MPNLSFQKHKLFVTLVLAVMFFSFDPSSVEAAAYEIEVSPARINKEIQPGTTYTQKYRLGNTSGNERTFFLYTRDFTVIDESGTPTFFENNDQRDESFSLTKWVELEEQSITLADQEFREIDVNIVVPEDAEAGGHYAALMVQTDDPELQQESAIGSVARIAALMLVTVPGDVNENISLVEFSTDKKYYLEDNPKINFKTVLKNEGNVHAIPTGIIFLSGAKNLKNTNLIYNEQQGAVLPNAPDRQITLTYQVPDTGFIPPMGKLQANLLIKYGSQRYEINAYEEVYILPIRFIAIVTVGSLALLFVIWRTIVSFKK